MIRSEGVTILPEAHKVINNLSPIEMKLIFYMAGRMERGNMIPFGSKQKKRFSEEIGGVKTQTIFNAVSKLKKVGLIKDYVFGSYIVNINCFSTVNDTSRMVSLDAQY